MASEPATPTTSASDSPKPTPNPLETTTAKDGNLLVNQTEAATDPAPAVPAPEVPISSSPESAEKMPMADDKKVTPASDAPIMVTNAEVSSNGGNSENLADEVEALSGEIQALESKIDRLTGNINPVEQSAKAEVAPKPEISKPETKAEEETTLVSKPAPTPPPAPEASKPPVSPINDIYSKVTERQSAPEPAPAVNNTDAEEIGAGAGVGVIGEVLSIFGLIIFIILAAYPFYKSMLTDSLADAVKAIGWPTAVTSLALGFVLFMFGRGKIGLKIIIFFVLLLAAVGYMGVSGYDQYLGPVAPMLDSVLNFYR